MPDGPPGLIAATSAAAYLCGAAITHISTRADRQPAGWHLLIVAGGWLLHATVLWLQILADTDNGISLGVADALSVSAWISAGLLMFLNLRQPIASLGLFLYPVAAFCVLLGAWLPQVSGPTLSTDWTVELHVGLSLLAYGFLSLSALLAIALGIQERGLRQHTPHGLTAALPPLETTERLMFQWIGTGFALLTLALLSGLFFVENWMAQHLAHKIILSLLAWLIFGGLLLGRRWRGWRGQRSVRWTLSGYAVLLLAYFGSKFVLEALKNTHWYGS